MTNLLRRLHKSKNVAGSEIYNRRPSNFCFLPGNTWASWLVLVDPIGSHSWGGFCSNQIGLKPWNILSPESTGEAKTARWKFSAFNVASVRPEVAAQTFPSRSGFSVVESSVWKRICQSRFKFIPVFRIGRDRQVSVPGKKLNPLNSRPNFCLLMNPINLKLLVNLHLFQQRKSVF